MKTGARRPIKSSKPIEIVEPKKVGTPYRIILSDQEKSEMFLECEFKTYTDVAEKHGLFEHYAIPVALKKVSDLFKEVLDNPARFNISVADASRIATAKAIRSTPIKGRRMSTPTVAPYVVEEIKLETPDVKTIPLKDLTIEVRNLALRLVKKKLEYLDRTEDVDGARLVELTTAFGTIFDKAQIMNGEATENIAVMAKIDKNMSPDDALASVLAMREQNQENKNVKK